LVFLGGLAVVAAAGWRLAHVAGGSADGAPFSFPSSFDELAARAATVRGLASEHPLEFAALLAAAYIFKQAFCTPGSALLNAVAGVAFGAVRGVPLACCLTGIGVAACYALSAIFAAPLTRLAVWSRTAPLRDRIAVARRDGSLALYLISLRLVPVFPQWAINIAAPHVGVSLPLFVVTSTLGLAPYNALVVTAAATAADGLVSAVGGNTSTAEAFRAAFGWRPIVGLLVIAMLLFAAPTVVRRAMAAGDKRRASAVITDDGIGDETVAGSDGQVVGAAGGGGERGGAVVAEGPRDAAVAPPAHASQWTGPAPALMTAASVDGASSSAASGGGSGPSTLHHRASAAAAAAAAAVSAPAPTPAALGAAFVPHSGAVSGGMRHAGVSPSASVITVAPPGGSTSSGSPLRHE